MLPLGGFLMSVGIVVVCLFVCLLFSLICGGWPPVWILCPVSPATLDSPHPGSDPEECDPSQGCFSVWESSAAASQPCFSGSLSVTQRRFILFCIVALMYLWIAEHLVSLLVVPGQRSLSCLESNTEIRWLDGWTKQMLEARCVIGAQQEIPS